MKLFEGCTNGNHLTHEKGYVGKPFGQVVLELHIQSHQRWQNHPANNRRQAQPIVPFARLTRFFIGPDHLIDPTLFERLFVEWR